MKKPLFTITTESDVVIAESVEALNKQVESKLNDGYTKGKSGETILDNFSSPITVYYQVLIKNSVETPQD